MSPLVGQVCVSIEATSVAVARFGRDRAESRSTSRQIRFDSDLSVKRQADGPWLICLPVTSQPSPPQKRKHKPSVMGDLSRSRPTYDYLRSSPPAEPDQGELATGRGSRALRRHKCMRSCRHRLQRDSGGLERGRPLAYGLRVVLQLVGREVSGVSGVGAPGAL